MIQTNDSPCIDQRVDPLMAELREAVALRHVPHGDPDQTALHGFVRGVFRQVHGAQVSAFHPDLLSFHDADGLRAVLGYRAGGDKPLFSEHYLDRPAEALLAERFGRAVRRDELVEVGNFALDHPGQARWVIAATTTFLAAAGYRWVLFTATRPLANAFRRLGLRPLSLAVADPARLPGGGANWGEYYAAGPEVYVGDILAGHGKLDIAVGQRSLRLRGLLDQAWEAGLGYLPEAPARQLGGRS